jgi:hypothetical protein
MAFFGNVSPTETNTIVIELHDGPIGHYGIKNTIKKIFIATY